MESVHYDKPLTNNVVLPEIFVENVTNTKPLVGGECLQEQFMEGVTKCGCGELLRKVLWFKKTRHTNKKGIVVNKRTRMTTWRCMDCGKAFEDNSDQTLKTTTVSRKGGGGVKGNLKLTLCEPKSSTQQTTELAPSVYNYRAPSVTKRRRETSVIT